MRIEVRQHMRDVLAASISPRSRAVLFHLAEIGGEGELLFAGQRLPWKHDDMMGKQHHSVSRPLSRCIKRLRQVEVVKPDARGFRQPLAKLRAAMLTPAAIPAPVRR